MPALLKSFNAPARMGICVFPRAFVPLPWGASIHKSHGRYVAGPYDRGPEPLAILSMIFRRLVPGGKMASRMRHSFRINFQPELVVMVSKSASKANRSYRNAAFDGFRASISVHRTTFSSF